MVQELYVNTKRKITTRGEEDIDQRVVVRERKLYFGSINAGPRCVRFPITLLED